MKKYQSFLSANFQFLEEKFSIYLNMRVFVMKLEALLQMVKNLSMYSTNSVTVVNYMEYDI